MLGSVSSCRVTWPQRGIHAIEHVADAGSARVNLPGQAELSLDKKKESCVQDAVEGIAE